MVPEVGTESLPRRLLTVPLARSDVPISGIVAKMHIRELEVWQLHALWDAAEEVLAKLLAILILDDAEPILQLQMMPARPSTAVLRSDGQIRHGRGYLLAPWALDEIGRLAGVLREHHRDYLRSISAALSQDGAPEFQPLPPGLVFADTIRSARIGPGPPDIEVDVSQSERVRFKLKWYQLVGEDYRRNRYLVLLSDEQLARRAEDILGNLHVVNTAGLVSFDRTDPTLRFWLSRLTEIQAEMALRHGPYPAGWKRGMIDLTNLPASLRSAGPGAAMTLQLLRPLPSESLVKYGKREFLKSALRDGEIRIAPASTYDDPSLNVAAKDDELCGEIYYDPQIPFNDVPPGTILLPPGRTPFRWRMDTDYYVYCLSERLSTRLVLDFEAQACLVIGNPEAFLSRVTGAVARQLGNWRFVADRVEYFDPLQVSPAEVRAPMWKHFRYAYQREVRLAWLPPKPVRTLQPLFVRLGSIEDIAELVVPSS